MHRCEALHFPSCRAWLRIQPANKWRGGEGYQVSRQVVHPKLTFKETPGLGEPRVTSIPKGKPVQADAGSSSCSRVPCTRMQPVQLLLLAARAAVQAWLALATAAGFPATSRRPAQQLLLAKRAATLACLAAVWLPRHQPTCWGRSQGQGQQQ